MESGIVVAYDQKRIALIIHRITRPLPGTTDPSIMTTFDKDNIGITNILLLFIKTNVMTSQRPTGT